MKGLNCISYFCKGRSRSEYNQKIPQTHTADQPLEIVMTLKKCHFLYCLPVMVYMFPSNNGLTLCMLGTFTVTQDPDEIPYNAAFHWQKLPFKTHEIIIHKT